MHKTQDQENVVASSLPAPAPHQPGILAATTPQSDLIAAAVKNGISSALEQLGYSSAPAVSVPHLEAPVTTLEDIRDNWKYPVDPTGERSKKKPWVERTWDKETGDLIVAKVIIPPGLFGRRMRPQGPTVAIAIANAKKMMEDQWAKDNKVAQMDARARGRFIDYQDKLEAKKIPKEAIWTYIDDAIRIAEARKEHKIPDTIDVVGLGINLAKNYTKTPRAWITEYTATFKPAKRPSPRGDIKTRTNARAILNRLDAYVVEKMGPKVSLLEVIKQKIHLTNFFNEELHTTTAGKIGARKRSWSELVAFFDYTAEEMERPSLSAKIHGGIPKGIKADVVAPKALNIQTFLDLIEDEKPTFLPLATMVVFFARPQESYAALEHFRTHLKDEWIDFPLSLLKVGVNFAHTVKLRPAPLLWFARDPRWQDPNVTDFRPRKKNGELYSYQTVEQTLSKYMKKAGWDGDLTKEYLRRSFVSAQIAVGNNTEDIIWELGHDDLSVLPRYNVRFTRAEGLALFGVVPRGCKPIPEQGSYEPCISPRRGLNANPPPGFVRNLQGK